MTFRDSSFSSASELKRISVAEMRLLLQDAYSRDPENSFLKRLMRQLEDPAIARDASDRLRLHPLWLTFGVTAFLVLIVLAVFSAVRG